MPTLKPTLTRQLTSADGEVSFDNYGGGAMSFIPRGDNATFTKLEYNDGTRNRAHPDQDKTFIQNTEYWGDYRTMHVADGIVIVYLYGIV